MAPRSNDPIYDEILETERILSNQRRVNSGPLPNNPWAGMLADNRGPTNSARTIGAPVGDFSMAAAPQGIVLDLDTQQELEWIQREHDLALAEHAARVANNAARANAERAQVRRQMGIAEDYGGIATGYANENYDALLANLEGIIPLTEQSYAAGVDQVGQAYSSGAENLAPQDNSAALAAQLAALTGEDTSAEAAAYSDPATDMIALLQGAQPQATANLQTLGAGDVAAMRNTLPGYRDEQQQVISDIGLEVGAELSELRNQLAQIVAEPIIFNRGELDLRMEQAVEEAVRRGQARQQEEEFDYSGLRGAQRYAQEQGHPELYSTFLDILSEANQGIPFTDPVSGLVTGTLDPVQAMYTAINSHTEPLGWISGRGGGDAQRILRELANIYSGNY